MEIECNNCKADFIVTGADVLISFSFYSASQNST